MIVLPTNLVVELVEVSGRQVGPDFIAEIAIEMNAISKTFQDEIESRINVLVKKWGGGEILRVEVITAQKIRVDFEFSFGTDDVRMLQFAQIFGTEHSTRAVTVRRNWASLVALI